MQHSVCMVIQDAVWLRQFLSDLAISELGMPKVVIEGLLRLQETLLDMLVYEANIDIWYNYVREAVQDRTIALEYCPTEEMLTNLFTKPLG